MILQTTLSLAAAAAVINIWLTMRVGRIRGVRKIWHGDGGDDLLMRRMRAQSNFIENAPLVLILMATIELTGRGATWLAVVGALFMLGRVVHALGMDNVNPNPLRIVGTLATVATQPGLAVVAVLIALGYF